MDWGNTIVNTDDNYFMVVGMTYSFGPNPPNMYILKIDSNGDTLWTKIYDWGDAEHANHIIPTTDNNYIIVGGTNSLGSGNFDVILLKIDSEGQIIWARTYGGDNYDDGIKVYETNDQGFIIVGWTQSYGNGHSDIYLIKTDENGDSIWTRTYGSGSSDCGNCVIQTPDYGFLIGGAISGNACLIKTDPVGYPMWIKTYTGEDTASFVRDLIKIDNEGYILAGNINEGYPNRENILLVKTDTNGNLLWLRSIGSVGDEYSFSITLSPNQGYLLTGFASYMSEYNLLVLKTDTSGNVQWQKLINISLMQRGTSIITDVANNIWVTGFISTPDSSDNVIVAKLGAENIPLFIRGDINADGVVNYLDLVKLACYIYFGEPIYCLSSADVNDDGQILGSDLLSLSNFLFCSGVHPPLPYPECGSDPIPDDLTCESHPFCDQK